MTRENNDPADLGRKATDARRSQQQMYDSLGNLAEAYEQGSIDADEFMDRVGDVEDRFGVFIEGAEEDYDTVDEFARELNEDITSVSFHYHEAEPSDPDDVELKGPISKLGGYILESDWL